KGAAAEPGLEERRDEGGGVPGVPAPSMDQQDAGSRAPVPDREVPGRAAQPREPRVVQPPLLSAGGPAAPRPAERELRARGAGVVRHEAQAGEQRAEDSDAAKGAPDSLPK